MITGKKHKIFLCKMLQGEQIKQALEYNVNSIIQFKVFDLL